ncbi:MAG TPA: hypothetical protein C5S51_04770 [Methanosarcinaceae archaeon]|nr:hypothetical protein [Methanosarcinaceae archaeon]
MNKSYLNIFVSILIIASLSSGIVSAEEFHHVDGCVVCHNMGGSPSNLYRIFEVINTPNSGPKDVIFTAYEGPNSYADGDTTYDGVCEVCHTETRHHQNDGDPDSDSHYAGTNCIECHSHFDGDEFSHGGPCEVCHGHDLEYEYEPGKFSEGAGTVQSHSTHTENDNDDLRGPHITCDDCHDTDNYPYFKTGTGEAPHNLSETDVCDTCHSAGGSINGINDAAVGAKENWDNGIYDSEGATLQSGKDKWCAGCHDEEPAEVGVLAPNIVGQYILENDGDWKTPVAIEANTNMTSAESLIDGDLNTGISAGRIGKIVVFDLGESVDVSHIRLYTENNTEVVFPPTVHWLVYGSNDLEEWTRILLGQSVMFAKPSWLTGLEDGWDESRLDMALPVRYIKLEKRNIWPCAPDTQKEFQYKSDLQYGYYETGHKMACDNCHDISSAHFDEISQTYSASLDNYQAGYRLRSVEVNGEVVPPMDIPRLGPEQRFYETNNNFALCFDCHSKSKLFGYDGGTGDFYKNPLETNFYNERKLDANGNETNQHRVHIQGLGWCGTGITWDSDWDSTADDWNMSYDSQMSCTACHNVHGSPSLAMIRHGELISTPGTLDKVPLLNIKYLENTSYTYNVNGSLDNGNGSYNILDTFGAQTQFYLPGRGNAGKNNMCIMCHNELVIYYRTPVIVDHPE